MNTNWQEWLSSPTRDLSGVAVPDYPAQCDAVHHGAVISPLTAFSLVRISGEDGLTFLQGQLSSDVRELNGENAQFSSYSTAKGRVLASFLLWQFAGDYYLLVSADIAAAICKRLSMFVMRSRVKVEVCNQSVLLGLKGARAEAWAGEHVTDLPSAPLALKALEDGGVCLRLAGGALLLVLELEPAKKTLALIPSDLVVVGAEAWSLLDIAAGIPWVTLVTQEQFVAQMINMDLLGGVSFTKGCYTGQEIIARTRYLGKVKRRMYRVRLPQVANNGAALYCPTMNDQPVGMLLNVTRDGNEGFMALAVVQTASWGDGIYLDLQYNEAVDKLSLPYVLAEE